MELLNFIFRLGVLFAIYGFLWGILEIGLTILRSGRNKTNVEKYGLKAVKYLFLVDVTILFCVDIDNGEMSHYHLFMAALVLLTYFIGKLQQEQNRLVMFQMLGSMQNSADQFNLKTEITVIVFSVILFIILSLFPEFADNPISHWFHLSITNIEDTPVFGFIFKMIGFFFLVSMISKMVNAFFYLVSGKPFFQATSSFTSSKRDKDKDNFDDFEEIP